MKYPHFTMRKSSSALSVLIPFYFYNSIPEFFSFLAGLLTPQHTQGNYLPHWKDTFFLFFSKRRLQTYFSIPFRYTCLPYDHYWIAHKENWGDRSTNRTAFTNYHKCRHEYLQLLEYAKCEADYKYRKKVISKLWSKNGKHPLI